jgi:hypothetical protein
MNPLQLELLANDRIAELRRHAPTARFGASVSIYQAPEPRVPRRGPLHSFTRLGLLLRGAFA